MAAKQPNTEDGGPSDWFTDTRPVVLAAIEKLRKDLLAASPATPAPSALTDERVFELVGEVLGQPLIVEDLRQGFAVHTEPRDWLNFARALLAASPAALMDAASYQRGFNAGYLERGLDDAENPGASVDALMDEREAFEAWIMDMCPNAHEDVFEQRVGNEYVHQSTTGKWSAWQAASKRFRAMFAAAADDQVEDARDAKRFQWLLDGNGFFMEEAGLCCYPPCSENEKNAARAEIDAAMSASKEGCTRSHPHENMSAECQHKTVEARAANASAQEGD